jgi:cytoskeletal protein CcmA (bactofilin family)
MAKIMETENNVINQIGIGTEITGDVSTNGDIRFEGTLKGNLRTKGKVVVGETGNIKGEINCKNSVIEGAIEGKITVAELLTLKATSTLKGDIITRRLAIEPGAKFTGNCSMAGETNADANKEQETAKTKEAVK